MVRVDFYGLAAALAGPWAPPTHLVEIGLYRFSRNPMYVCVLLVLAGWTVLDASRWLACYAIIVAIGFHLQVVLREEPSRATTANSGWPIAPRIPDGGARACPVRQRLNETKTARSRWRHRATRSDDRCEMNALGIGASRQARGTGPAAAVGCLRHRPTAVLHAGRAVHLARAPDGARCTNAGASPVVEAHRLRRDLGAAPRRRTVSRTARRRREDTGVVFVERNRAGSAKA